MTWQSIAIGLMALVVLCWGLGAYNRLVRLRAKVRADFVPVHEGLEQAAQWLHKLGAAHMSEAESASLSVGLHSGPGVDESADANPGVNPDVNPDAKADAHPDASAVWASASAAAQQLLAALAPVRREPLDAAAMAALNTAHEVFVQAVGRLSALDEVSGRESENTGGDVVILLSIVEKTQKYMAVDVAAQAFNAQVQAHNAAVRQFPARGLAWFLGFAPAGRLDEVTRP